MAFYFGERVIQIASTRAARKYGNWYKALVGMKFTAIAYSITAAEYTVKHNSQFQFLPDEDVKVVKDTSRIRCETLSAKL